MKKKLSYFQIHRVISIDKCESPIGLHREMQQVSLTHKELPEGHFSVHPEGVILPKRKRGQKFVVQYTRIFEKVL